MSNWLYLIGAGILMWHAPDWQTYVAGLCFFWGTIPNIVRL